MSLIMDALQRTQQLRSKDRRGTPFFHPSVADRRNRRSTTKTLRIFAVAGFGILLVFFSLINQILPPGRSEQSQTTTLAEEHEAADRPFLTPTRKGPDQTPSPASNLKPEGLARLSRSELPQIALSPPANPAAKELGEEAMRPRGEMSPLPDQRFTEKTSEKLILSVAVGRNEQSKSTTLEQEKEKILSEESKPLPLGPPKVVTKIESGKRSVTEKDLVPPRPFPARETTPAMTATGATPSLDSERHVPLEIVNHFNLGVQNTHQGNLAKAIQAYKKVIALDPSYVEAYNNLGIIYQEIGESDRALEAYRKSIETNPTYEKAYNNLGILLYTLGRHDESMEAFQKALALNPSNVESQINLGTLFKKRGQPERAIECYQRALSISPLHADAHYNLGLLYEQSDHVELAIGHYQKFIQRSSASHPDLVSKVKKHLGYLMATQDHPTRDRK